MLFRSRLMSALAISAVSSMATQVSAFERDHSAHEHGHATLAVVVEGNELVLNFESPAIDIVGFEHQPKNHDQEHKIEDAEKILKDAGKLFELSESAGCVLEHAKVSSSLMEKAESGHDHHHGHVDHDDEYGDDDHHGHDDHHGKAKEESHSEFAAEYHFECKDAAKLDGVSVRLLSFFPSIKELEAQVIGPKGQSLQELNASKTEVSL